MSQTFDQMVDDVLVYLRSFTRDQNQSTHLTTGLAADAYTMDVNDPTIISRGRVEISDELIWVDKVDRANKVVTIAPYGRGMDGTTAAAHLTDTRIIIQPLYSRQMVKDTINQIIGGLGSQLYAVETLSFASVPTQVLYHLPAYTQRVLNVLATDFSEYKDSEYIRRWRFDPQTNDAAGKGLYVYEPTATGMKIEVTLFRSPVQLITGNTFDNTLLPPTSYDVIILGTAARLLSTATSYLASTRAIEPGSLDRQVDPNQITQQSRYLYTLFTQRLEEEKVQLLHRYTTRAHYTG